MTDSLRRALLASLLGLAACAPQAPHLDLEARWYLAEPPGTPEKDGPYFSLYLAVVNWGDQPLLVDRIAFAGIDAYDGSKDPWLKGVVREYDLGPFRCVLPTRMRVCMNGQWLDAGIIERRMPSSLPANPSTCPGSLDPKAPPPKREARPPRIPGPKECPDEIGLLP